VELLIEHANITVASIQEAQRFLSTAFPEFRVRGGGYLHDDESLGQWVHFGTDESYLAIQQNSTHSHRTDTTYTNDGINHLGFVVADMDELLGRMAAAGYKATAASALDGEHRRRAYFFDDNGFEWEFVQYLSDAAAQRNHYE